MRQLVAGGSLDRCGAVYPRWFRAPLRFIYRQQRSLLPQSGFRGGCGRSVAPTGDQYERSV